MNYKPSKRVASIEVSATSGMSRRASSLKSLGMDIIDLSRGEPDFSTPRHICAAAKDAIDSRKYFSYPPTAGYSDLREAIAEKYRMQNGLSVTRDQVVVSNGAKQALSNVMFAYFNPGDEVIILAPYWVSYYAQVVLAGCKPIILKGDFNHNFKVSVDQIEGAITKKTKAILFSSPGNPTGSVYSKLELIRISKLLHHHHQILIIADEIYEYINYTGEFTSFGSLDGMEERTVTINGFSKSYAMTGWRVGYSISPLWLATDLVKFQGHVSSSNCSIAQRAALAAITIESSSVEDMVSEYMQRRNTVYDFLKSIPGVKTNLPDGAFYFFPMVNHFFGQSFDKWIIENPTDLCEFLLEKAGVALVSGDAFGEKNCVRISYAASQNLLDTGLSRIKSALSLLRV